MNTDLNMTGNLWISILQLRRLQRQVTSGFQYLGLLGADCFSEHRGCWAVCSIA